VSSAGWTDDELLSELGAALREPPVDEDIIRAARAAFTWRTVDAELEILSLDPDPGLAGAAMVRGGAVVPRMLTFHGETLSVTVEIDEAGIVGQLTPPGPGQVTLVTADGPAASAQADEVGSFALPPCPAGPARLDCTLGDARFVTEWTVF